MRPRLLPWAYARARSRFLLALPRPPGRLVRVRLPTMFGAAAALFTNPGGQVLLVKPNYRAHWSLPGGILDKMAEPPH